jgi:hypothetical protein
MRGIGVVILIAVFFLSRPAQAIMTPEWPLNVEISEFAAGPSDINGYIEAERMVTPEPTAFIFLLAACLMVTAVWMERHKGAG